MPTIRLNQFGGVVPRYHPSVIRDNQASHAHNCKLWHGTLAPFRMPAPVYEAPESCVRTMYRFECCWLTWDNPCVDVAEWLPTCRRVFVTGADVYPLVSELPAEGCAFDFKRVGLPAPENAPQVVPVDASKPIQTTSSRVYVYTYVNSFGEEGVPSPPSDALLDMYEGAAAVVSIDVPPAGWDIAAIRLYRVQEGVLDGTAAAAPTGSAYLFVTELPPQAQSFTDDIPADGLAEGNVSLTYSPPPDGLRNITQLPDGVLAGSVGRQVWFCESYQPQAWPLDTMLQLDDDVIALVWSNGVLYALTDGHPYAISEQCVDGNCCREAWRFPKPMPIASKKSAAAAADGAVYAGASGLVLLAGKRMAVITGPWFGKDDWQALLPHTMTGAMVDGQYFASTCKTTFLFSLRDGVENDGLQGNDLMPLTLTPNALHTARDGKLYLAFGNVVHEWDAGADFLPYCWRSKQLAQVGQTNFAAAKVTLDGYPYPALAPFGVTFRLLTDGRQALARPVKHSAPFRLPSNRRNLNFEVEVSGTESVRDIVLATSMSEMSA
ncbi:hypothetical protein [Dyella sp.]|uniref:hypothetical protein n=1 Tax=Dyella sp. TaxID=1869338 RepID=UPI002FD98A55